MKISEKIGAYPFLKKMTAGLMLYNNSINKAGEPETAFYIKEEPEYLSLMGDSPNLKVISHMFKTRFVDAFFMMVMAENNEQMLYDGWINYYAPYDGKVICEYMAKHDEIEFIIFDELMNIQKEIKAPNTIRNQIQEYIKDAKGKGYWEMSQYDKVKSYVYKKYPNGQILWNALLGNSAIDMITDITEIVP